MNVLISLYRGYGLGDAVQVSAVLRHIAKHYSHWSVDYQAEEGYHCVGRGLVANVFAYGERYPRDHYDREFQICLYDKWVGWRDRPNTHVSTTLKDIFDLDWDRHCGRYHVPVSAKAAFEAGALVRAVSSTRPQSGGIVAVHYEGRTARANKDLTVDQARVVCQHIEALGCTPLLLDWEGTSPMSRSGEYASVGNVRVEGAPALVRSWGGDAEMVCAVVQRCRAFVGIDSGPSKCASATEVPSLVVWTKHHPAKFHDPAPNTTHLVPHDFHGHGPVLSDSLVTTWFDRHYQVWKYNNHLVNNVGMVGEIKDWLTENLR